jgi:hypothetical protein
MENLFLLLVENVKIRLDHTNNAIYKPLQTLLVVSHYTACPSVWLIQGLHRGHGQPNVEEK